MVTANFGNRQNDVVPVDDGTRPVWIISRGDLSSQTDCGEIFRCNRVNTLCSEEQRCPVTALETLYRCFNYGMSCSFYLKCLLVFLRVASRHPKAPKSEFVERIA